MRRIEYSCCVGRLCRRDRNIEQRGMRVSGFYFGRDRDRVNCARTDELRMHDARKGREVACGPLVVLLVRAENQEEARGRTRAGGDNITSSRIHESRPEQLAIQTNSSEGGKCAGGASDKQHTHQDHTCRHSAWGQAKDVCT